MLARVIAWRDDCSSIVRLISSGTGAHTSVWDSSSIREVIVAPSTGFLLFQLARLLAIAVPVGAVIAVPVGESIVHPVGESITHPVGESIAHPVGGVTANPPMGSDGLRAIDPHSIVISHVALNFTSRSRSCIIAPV